MRELILTGYEKFWPKDREAENNALYLGPWCFAGNKKRTFLEQTHFDLAKPPWENWDEIKKELEYTELLTLRLMPILASYANDKNHVVESDLFWKKILLPWVSIWLQNFYDRYKRIETTLVSGEVFTVKIAKNYNRSTVDYLDFIHGYRSHAYNLFLMSSLIRHSSFNKSLIVEEHDIEIQPYSKVKDSFGDLIHRLINLLPFPLYMESVYGINFLEEFYFQIKTLFSGKRKNLSHQPSDKNQMTEVLSDSKEFIPESDFESIVIKEIWKYIPIDLLAYRKSGRIKKLIIGNNYFNSDFQYRVAHSAIRGGKWISFQHGGGYGEFKLWPQGFIEYWNADGFITWGWKEHLYTANFQALSSPKLSKSEKYQNRDGNLIYVSTMHPAYCMRFQSALLPEQQLQFIMNTKTFFETIEKNILKNAYYRPYSDLGQGAQHILKNLIADDHTITSGTIIPHLKKCRLAVIDHMATSFHETLVMGTPTIMFWDPSHFGENPKAKIYFDKLRHAGILFNDASSAAAKVNEIWNGIDSWWNSKQVRLAVEEFCNEFARTNPKWKREWAGFISRELQTVR
jgi:putative transferase (TIGR04331 family)